MHSSKCPEKEKDFEKQHSLTNFLQDDLVMSGFHSCLTDVKGRIFGLHFPFFRLQGGASIRCISVSSSELICWVRDAQRPKNLGRAESVILKHHQTMS